MKKLKLIAKSCFLAKYSVIVGITGSMLMACNGGSSTGANSVANIQPNQLSNRQTQNNLKDRFLVSMGSGYDSFTNSATSDQLCLVGARNPNNIIINNPTYSSFTQINIDSLQNLLNVDVVGNIGGDRFDSLNEADFANYSKDTDYSTNILYAYRIEATASFKPGSLGVGYAALIPAAQSVVNNPAAFRSMCGDNYVSQMSAGAFILVRLNLNFNSGLDKRNFLETYQKASLGNILTSIQQTVESLDIPVNIKMDTFQEGGDPSRISQLSRDLGLNNAQVTCSGVLTESCGALINKVYQYAPTLINQIESSSGDFDPSKLYYYDPRLEQYASLAIPVPIAPNPSLAIMSAMRQLVSEYDNAVSGYNFVRHYQYSLGDKLDITVQEDLKNIQAKLNNQINNVFLKPVFGIYRDCYTGYVTNSCLATTNTVESELDRYQLTNEESYLLNYLESNSYSASIINYYGESTPESSDYYLSKDSCVFAPTGMWIDNTYAVNCSGIWLNTKSNGIVIRSQSKGAAISISNFNYLSTNPNNQSFGQWISYADDVLTQDPAFPNEFKGNGKVSAPNYNANLGLVFVQLNSNPF